MSVAERLREEGRTKGRVEGRSEGQRESKARIARRLLEKGMSIADIAGIVELEEEEVRRFLRDTHPGQ